MANQKQDNPLSLPNLLAGIIVTVVGGIILAYIIQDGRFAPKDTPTSTSTPLVTPTHTDSIQSKATETPTPSPTPSLVVVTPSQVIKTVNPSSCDVPAAQGKYISQSIPDNTVFHPGDVFVQNWNIENTGNCTWSTGFTLTYFAGEHITEENDIYLPVEVPPGTTVTVPMTIHVPNKLGQVEAMFVLRDERGENIVMVNMPITVK